MIKENYLVLEEQRIWCYIKDKDIINNESLAQLFPDWKENKRNKILHSLYRKKYLLRARRDLYYNPEKIQTLYSVALQIHEGYVGLHSALKWYNLSDYEDFTIIIITKNFQKKISMKGSQYEIHFIPLHNLFMGYERKDGIIVSNLEKTFFDCFLKPNMVGYSIITKALFDAEINWKLFISYFAEADNSALYQRTGYILELLQKKTKKKIPPFVFETLKKKIKNPVRLLAVPGQTTYNSDWKVQDNIGEEKILSWWKR